MGEGLCAFGDGRHKKAPWSNLMPSGALVEGETRPRSGLVCVRCHKTWEYHGDELRPTFRSPGSSEDMVERGAIALHAEATAAGETGSRRSWSEITDEERNGFFRLARAAIAAMKG